MKDKIYIGAAYYPEHWPEDRWEKDVRLMKDAGIRVVRLAELAWSFLEPEDGKFDFTWLDRFVALAYENGIETVLGTPTEITPSWMNLAHPDVAATNREGRIQGGRGNHCYNSPALNRYVERIVGKMAHHYKDNPAVIGWQLDNEIRGTKCYCPVCREKYREWLKDRYRSLEQLNREWGTCFWSQVYHSWEEVQLPGEEQMTVSTSQIMDHFRFASHSAVQFLKRQAALIKSAAANQFVSHNSLGLCEWVNLYEMGDVLDVMGLDSYPYVDDDNYGTCMAHDLARSTKKDAYWIWEQKNGYVNYHTYNMAIDPGLVRLWTWQDIARGANGIVYYRFRSNRYRYEQNPNGILRHDGSPRPVYGEIAGLCRELEGFSKRLARTRVEADVAIVYSYEQMWDEHTNRQYQNMSYQKILLSYYKAFTSLGLTADLVEQTSDFSGYRLAAAPGMAVINEEIAENFKKYTENGGYLVLGVRSGIKTWAGAMTDLSWPGLLADLAGVRIDEFEVLPADKTNRVRYGKKEYPVSGWTERLTVVSGKAEAQYCDNFYAGDTAVSQREYGAGRVLYIGVMENEELIHALLLDAVTACNLTAHEVPEGVFMTRRAGEEDRFWFVINKNRHPVTVSLGVSGKDMLTGQAVSDRIEIPALDLAVIRQEPGVKDKSFAPPLIETCAKAHRQEPGW